MPRGLRATASGATSKILHNQATQAVTRRLIGPIAVSIDWARFYRSIAASTSAVNYVARSGWLTGCYRLAMRWTFCRDAATGEPNRPPPVRGSWMVLPAAIITFHDREERRVQVLVRDNNVDQALKALKKKMQREGIFREMKLRGHYEKPSEKKAREKAEAIRRARKLARKRAQR